MKNVTKAFGANRCIKAGRISDILFSVRQKQEAKCCELFKKDLSIVQNINVVNLSEKSQEAWKTSD